MPYAPTPPIAGGGNLTDNYDLPPLPEPLAEGIPTEPLAQMPPAGGTVDIKDKRESSDEAL